MTELKINSKDAYATWGLVMEKGGLNALMTPSANKAYIENKSTQEHGKQVYIPSVGAKVEDRSIQLPIAFMASSEAQFYQRYLSFCEELRGGWLNIETSYQPNIIYKCTYESCQSYNAFNGRLAKFILKLNEPNPMDRSK